MPEIAKFIAGQRLRHGADAGDDSRPATCRCARSSSPRRRRSTTRAPTAARSTAISTARPARSPSSSGATTTSTARSVAPPPTPVPTDEAAPIGGENVYAITQADPGAAGHQLGTGDGYPRRRAALLLHLWTAPIALQPLHRRDRHLLHPPAQRSAAGRLRGRAAVTRPDLRRGRRPGQPARRRRSARDGQRLQRRHRSGRGDRRPGPLLAERLGKPIAPLFPGEFRPGEMRALISDVSASRGPGFAPAHRVWTTGIDRYLDWIRTQGSIGEYFAAAERCCAAAAW